LVKVGDNDTCGIVARCKTSTVEEIILRLSRGTYKADAKSHNNHENRHASCHLPLLQVLHTFSQRLRALRLSQLNPKTRQT